MKTKAKIAATTLAAAAGGLIAGWLTAPKSGKETRADIKDAAAKAREEAATKIAEIETELKAQLEKATSMLAGKKDKGSEAGKKAVAEAKLAQDKLTSIAKALKAGEAKDKDLDSSLKEARRSLSDLKKFLKS